MSGVNQALAPFTLKGFYLLTWGTALGTNVWHSISSFKAYSTLTHETFSHLTATTTPTYLATTSTLTGALLGTHLYFHPVLVSSPLRQPHWYQIEEGVQGLFILAALVPQVVNWLVVAPAATRVMYERHRLERTEGKGFDSPNPSQAMTEANQRFQLLHGLSSALNSVALVALVGLGLAVSM